MAFPTSSEEYEPGRLTTAVLWLVAINVAIYFVQLTLQKDFPALLGFDANGFRAQWWGPLTYMFVHAGFWHLALNMYTLWAFGPRVEHAMGTSAFVPFYLWSGLGGVALHWLWRPGALLVGASAAIFGVMFAYARRWPDEEVYFFGVVPMRMKWLLWFMVAVNLGLGALSLVNGDAGIDSQPVAYLAHLGGILFAWLYLVRPAAPSVERFRARVAPAPDLGDEPPRPVPRSLPRPRERGSEVDEVVEQSKALTVNKPPRPTVVAPRPAITAANRREALDLVLDKISEQGLQSLTLDERRLLEEMSRTFRTE
jgi:membrane associated rhomboid family serine protease